MTGVLSGLAGGALLAVPFLLVPAALRIRDLAGALAAGAVAAAATVVAASIALSLVHGLTRGWMLLAQALIAGLTAVMWRRAGSPRLPRARLPALRGLRQRAEAEPALAVVLAMAAVVLVVQAVMAVAVAPNNWDSMTYHLSRIAYWLQNDSALHYHAGTIRQLGQPPNGELLQGWTILLTGTDRLANLVQWVALCGLATAIFATARALGFARAGSLFAAGLFVILPQPIMQASSTQNDLIVCFFLVAGVLFALRGLADRDPRQLAVCAVALGLAVGAKGTALVAGPSVALVLGVAIWRTRPPRALLVRFAGMLAVAAVALGSFNYVENVDTFGDPIGEVRTQVERTSPIPENAVRVAWSFVDAPGTPMPWFDLVVGRPTRALLGDLTTPAFSGFTLDTQVDEDLASYGLFGLLVLLPWLVFVLVARRSPPAHRALAAGALGYIVVFALFNEQNPWIGRVLMPSVALGAPLLAGLHRRRLLAGVGVACALLAVGPSLLVNERKPIAVPVGTQTIFKRDRVAQQTLSRPELGTAVARLNGIVAPDDPIGLVRGEDTWDYPFFGRGLQRRVVPLESGDVTAPRAREEGIVGVVYANVGAPRRPGAVTLAPGYVFVPAAALGG